MEPISTALAAFAAVQKTVELIKKASATVDDVASLGPLIGKYFDAKHEATKAVRESKRQGGSNLGKAVEIELALKSQRDFEEQLKGLFFPNNMDVWKSIMERVAQMDQEDKEEQRRQRDAAIRRKKEMAKLVDWLIAFALAAVCTAFIVWGAYKLIVYCQEVGCRT